MKHTPNKILLLFFLLLGCTARQVGTPELVSDPFTNELSKASSPYLLRQSHQLIQWRSWGKEVIELAERTDKLLLISIGFSASIWCHRMEEEVFADTSVAEYINPNFIPVKIDREERPDVDAYYLSICQLLSPEKCGWPLQVIALPDGRPVVMSTVMEQNQWLEWLHTYQQLYQEDPDRLHELADEIHAIFEEDKSHKRVLPNSSVILEEDLLKMLDFLLEDFHLQQRQTPQFPMPAISEFLLQYEQQFARRSENVGFGHLDKMAHAAIYDQLGGGFFRLVRDELWREPEFEKMLYDNAQLVSVYSHAYQLNPQIHYAQVVYETLEFLQRELKDPDYGYYTSLDAESEGEEGRYYLWTVKDFEVALDSKAELLARFYNLSLEGNMGDGQNILYRQLTEEELAYAYRMALVNIQDDIAQARNTLMEERRRRVLPARDKKQITAWNAMMISALATASRAFDESEWKESAMDLANFCVEKLWREDGTLARYYLKDQVVAKGFLDDYSLTALAFLDMYEITFDERWIERAEMLVVEIFSDFYDTNRGMFWYAPYDMEASPSPLLEIKGGVAPSSNALMCRVLRRLGTYVDKHEYTQIADEMLYFMWPKIQADPLEYPQWNQLILERMIPQYQLVIIGKDCHQVRADLSRAYLQNVQLFGASSSQTSSIPLLQGKGIPSQTLMYVCQDGVCNDPVLTIPEVLEQMQMAE